MKAVSKRICTKIAGCPAYSCDDATCMAKKVSKHEPTPAENSVGERHNHSWYGTARWKAIRIAQLSKEPLCQRCKSFGVITPGHHVDHVIEHKGSSSLFFDKTNLQTLCLSCHTHKTNAERAGTILDYR